MQRIGQRNSARRVMICACWLLLLVLAAMGRVTADTLERLSAARKPLVEPKWARRSPSPSPRWGRFSAPVFFPASGAAARPAEPRQSYVND